MRLSTKTVKWVVTPKAKSLRPRPPYGASDQSDLLGYLAAVRETYTLIAKGATPPTVDYKGVQVPPETAAAMRAVELERAREKVLAESRLTAGKPQYLTGFGTVPGSSNERIQVISGDAGPSPEAVPPDQQSHLRFVIGDDAPAARADVSVAGMPAGTVMVNE